MVNAQEDLFLSGIEQMHFAETGRGRCHRCAGVLLRLQVVRSYMHLSGSGPFSGLKDAVTLVWKEDGLRGFYR